MTPTSQHPLIDAETLKARLASQPDSLILFDCRFSLDDTGLGRRRYLEGHIPGARYAHLDNDLSSPITPQSGRHPLPDPVRFGDWLGRCGVSKQHLVVAYDDAGGMLAARLWWLLRWVGHEAVAVLDGGLPAWLAAGGALETEVPEPTPAVFEAKPDDDLWLSAAALEQALAADEVCIVDARSPERFSGEQEPLDPVGGHIPGAINLPCDQNLLQGDGRFLPDDALRARFAATIGSHRLPRVVHSCGSGVTACHNLLAMEVAGLGFSRLYPGSWSEWIRSPQRAVATGRDAA
jgi:thiosulfate/3-mercaptopyruvate sulfurtransferase